MDFWDIFLGVLFLIICFLLIVIVLLQKGKGGGLGAAFGGMGQAAFGTKTGDVFTWVTIVLTGLFLLLAVGASLSFRPTPGEVRQPEFLPPAGQYAEPVNVTISARTDGSATYFTTDGTEPDENSSRYDKPVRVTPPMTLKARSYREKWTPSIVTTGVYALPDANSATQPVEAIPPASRPATPAPAPAPAPKPAPTTAPATQPAPAGM